MAETLTRKQAILAWHFLPDDGRTGYDHAGRGRVLVHAGKKLVHRGAVIPRQSGLHACERAHDALAYACGSRVCRVACWGEVVRDDDVLACTHRAVLWMADATSTLWGWACDVAESMLRDERAAGREPHACVWAAVETRRRWLRGEASDVELRKAANNALCPPTTRAAHAASWAARVSLAAQASWMVYVLAAAREAHEQSLVALFETLAPRGSVSA
ncbi:MAG TPA: hypothetical protein VHH11_13950 [Gammaproteobacteria bacterium]|nr:hypothetical protein [Gammaproteobacteria bacterium]